MNKAKLDAYHEAAESCMDEDGGFCTRDFVYVLNNICGYRGDIGDEGYYSDVLRKLPFVKDMGIHYNKRRKWRLVK